MIFNAIVCPSCQSMDIVKHGVSGEGKDRYKCRNVECKRCTFIFNYTGCIPVRNEHKYLKEESD